MSTLTASRPVSPAAPASHLAVDNRLAYAFFAAAYVLGHGATALVLGGVVGSALPAWLPLTVLGVAFAAGTVAATVAAMRAQKGLVGGALTSARLLGMAWISGFTGLFLVITGLTQVTGDPSLQTLLWPTGSALVVGLIYIAEGAHRRDTLHYALGTWLAVLGGVALLLPAPLTLALMTVGGGGAYIAAIALDHARRRAL